jgi:hypothetical protein
MQKPKKPICFALGFDKEPRSSLCVCFLVGIQLEKSTSFYLLQENLVICNMYVCGVSEANDYLQFKVTDLHLWTQGSFGYLYYRSPKHLYTLLRW